MDNTPLRKAADRGLILKAHAEEFGPASNIEFAIEKLGKRIQHGVSACESHELMNKLQSKTFA